MEDEKEPETSRTLQTEEGMYLHALELEREIGGKKQLWLELVSEQEHGSG